MGEPIEAITTRAAQAYFDDMAALNTLTPDIQPRATQHIGQMITIIETLIAKKHAYAAQGHVLFNVPSMSNYGELSRRSRDELVAGARIDVAPYKKDAADFVLWKPSTPEQVGWDSPWGRGRPGWHIECSAMAAAHLGTTFDIHGGGLDLIFPHHENEIAQSRCAHDNAPLAKYWMHNGFLTINSDKMSKSLKNFYTVRELLAIAPGEALRFALLTGHYRQPLDFSVEALQKAKATLDKLYRTLEMSPYPQETLSGEKDAIDRFQDMEKKFHESLADDLNTPAAITILHEMASFLRVEVNVVARDYFMPKFRECAHALGILQQNPNDWFRWQPANISGLSDAEIEAQIAARIAARAAKNYAESDRIRDTLAAQGVILEDSAGKTTWRRG